MRRFTGLLIAIGLTATTSATVISPDRARLEPSIAAVEAGRMTTPLIGEPGPDGYATVTFLARRGKGGVPRIVSDVTGWGEGPGETFSFTTGTMKRVGRGDWYHLEARVAPRARIEYLIADGVGDYRPDPHNPRRARRSDPRPASEFVMPGFADPPELRDPPAREAGRVNETSIESRVLGARLPVLVYTPPGYRPGGAYPLALFHEGLSIAHTGEAARILDWLTERHMIEPLVMVCVDSWRRGAERPQESAVREFLVHELPAWTVSHYDVSHDPSKRAVFGTSFSAKDALDAATDPRGPFGGIGLLIPGRRLLPANIQAMAARPSRPLRAFVLAGQYDGPNLDTAQRIRTALSRVGHVVHYLEVPEGHNQSTWRNHLSQAFVSLFPSR